MVSATPRRSSKEETAPHLSPVSEIVEEEPTPACVRLALGPTPQKDGEILGIFDMLPAATPSKGVTVTNAPSEPVVSATPSKSAPSASSEVQQSRTPQSSSRRFYLEAFAGTPLKRKREDDVYTPSTAKQNYATPSFLQRNFSLSRIEEDNEEAAAKERPFKKRGLVRSLSTIIQGLKKQEEERLNDEWDVMNEIEAEQRGGTLQSNAPKILAEDSQAAEVPLGPDKGVGSGDEASDVDAGSLDVNGKPRKAWKKRGLKRQTRRVLMRPVLHQPKKAEAVTNSDSELSESEVVAETQLQEDLPAPSEGLHAPEPSFEKEAEDPDYKHDSQQSNGHSTGKKSKKHKHAKMKEKTDGKDADSETKSTSRKSKVSAQAHANFRKLNIKNKNSKASGRGRKFGRR